jgi:hypothetical protein
MGRATKTNSLMIKPHALAESRVLTDSDSGKTYFLNDAMGFTVTLPRPRGGVNFKFIVKTAPTSGNYLITTNADANVILGHIITNDQNAAVDSDFATTAVNDINIVSNIAIDGDSLEVVSDGTYWYASGFCSVNNAMTLD